MIREEDGRIVFQGASDLPLNAASLGSMDHNRTGSWRVLEPYYADMTPPCGAKCPAGSDIVRWLARAADGRPREALEILREANPFPAICGRVCPHPCEDVCSRRSLGGAVGVHHIERSIGDYGLCQGVAVEPRARRTERVAVVGSGPAGLSCAFFLGRQGFQVTVYEALPAIGGLLRTGIPPYRLPRTVIAAELQVFRRLSVSFETGRKLGANLTRENLSEFDACFLAVGRQASRRAGIQGEDLPGVRQGIDFLRALELGGGLPVEGRVVVGGGGNTAIDCARSALRLGARPVVVYRRAEHEMPAFPEEVEEAREEGVEFVFQAAPVKVLERDGRAARLQFVRTRPGEPGPDGRRTPVVIPGSEFEMEAGEVILAFGEEVDAAPLGGLMPPRDRVFAGGDLVEGGTVSAAIGEGRRAAAAIETLLAGKTGIAVNLPVERGTRFETVPPERINAAYFHPAPPIRPTVADPAERKNGFLEVCAGLDARRSAGEAQRCLSCGTCVPCDNCLIFCPDSAIVRDDGGYRILHEYCKGCGVCAEECPRGAIHVKKVAT